MRRDYASEIVGLVSEVASLEPAVAARIDAELRQRFAGTELRIAERPPLTLEQIDAGLRERKSVREIAGERGVSRATIYRMLGSGKSLRRQRA